MGHVVVCSSHFQLKACTSPALCPCCRLWKEGTGEDACLYHLSLYLHSYTPLEKDKTRTKNLKVNEQIKIALQ